MAYDQEADYIFADATNGALVARHPTVHRAKSWRTYDANNGTSLPGTLRCTNTGTCSDSVEQDIHDNASTSYDYYNVKFGRDSYNGSGATITSTAHYSNSYVNAFWNGTQLVYGDGDGVNSGPLGGALDVVAHELTHAVTSNESNLVYQNESGALNESLSDIFAAAAEAWVDGGGAVAFSSVLESGGPDFDDSARTAVERSAFRPARLDGREVASRVSLRIHFRLQ